MDNIKEALHYLVGLGEDMSATEVLDICGHTYANKSLKRYDEIPKASAIKAATLTAMVDYIAYKAIEFPSDMILYVESPTEVTLMSGLDTERKREYLFTCDANVSEFRFDSWYDQERFVIELQANFQSNSDLQAILQVAGNVEAKTTANYGDDGISQKTTIKTGIAALEDVIVPNPCILIPYRTFQEVGQPASKFVFRIKDGGRPEFKLIEAENKLWRNEAIANIKGYFYTALSVMDKEIAEKITVIG